MREQLIIPTKHGGGVGSVWCHKLDPYYGFGDTDVSDGTEVDSMGFVDWKDGGRKKQNAVIHTHKEYKAGDSLAGGTVFRASSLYTDPQGNSGYLVSITKAG